MKLFKRHITYTLAGTAYYQYNLTISGKNYPMSVWAPTTDMYAIYGLDMFVDMT